MKPSFRCAPKAPQGQMTSPNGPQSPRAKSKTGTARHFQPQLIHREVGPDLEDRHHLAPLESGKITRMYILIPTGQSNILRGKNVGENPPQQTLLSGGNPELAVH